MSQARDATQDPSDTIGASTPGGARQGGAPAVTPAAAPYGRTPDGTPITEARLQRLADEAERGYDVEAILDRRRGSQRPTGGRPSMGSAAASVESVRMDPELKRDLLARAAAERVSVSELIRTALRAYLKAG